MKILLSAVGIIAIVGLSLALCSSPAPSHGGGARIAIYNLSSTVRLLEQSIDSQFSGINSKMDSMETKLSDLDKKIDRMFEDMSRQLTRLEDKLGRNCKQE